LLGDAGTPADAEEIDGLTAVRAGESAHVLDDADDLLVRLAGEHAGAHGHFRRGLLRSRDHDDL
jgi:hypothetical protein